MLGVINEPYIQWRCCLNTVCLCTMAHIFAVGGRRSQPMSFSFRFLCSSLSNAPMCPCDFYWSFSSQSLFIRVCVWRDDSKFKEMSMFFGNGQWQWAACHCLEEYGHHCRTEDAAVDRLPWDSWGRTLITDVRNVDFEASIVKGFDHLTALMQ